MQTLPQAATDYSRATTREQVEAVKAIRRQWRRVGTDFDRGWSLIAPSVIAIVSTAQRRMVDEAIKYVPEVLEDTGQTRAIRAAAESNTSAFVGVTGAGVSTSDALSVAPIRAKQAVASGETASQALRSAGLWLTASVGTILSDTGRAAETTEIAVRPIGGYVRMLTPPSCGRCVVLAGKRYKYNAGFDRHPGCDCRHIPASESVAGDLTVDLHAYLDSLDEAGQIKLLGSRANYEAWKEYGANPQQIINAYRGGIRTAQDLRGGTVKYTTDASTRLSAATYWMRNASRLDRDAGAVFLPAGGRGLVRRMPETILRTTQGRDRILHQLRLYGWIG